MFILHILVCRFVCRNILLFIGTGGRGFQVYRERITTNSPNHIMPMIMAMTLYLLDVLYAISMRKSNQDKSLFWILSTIIVFMVTFVFSLLVNCNVLGWVLFILSWLSLTILKFQTTESEQSPYLITED